MKETIIRSLESLAAEQDITILYACESGSRAWGFPSTDSDYDVRFIYIHREDWYISIKRGKDTIDLPIDGELDLGGWELAKSLGLAAASNAVIWEWLQSPIIYSEREAFRERLFEALAGYYSLKGACYHYLSQVKKTIDEHLKGDKIKLKKYFYILRPLLAAHWICEKRSVPPMEFALLLEQINDRTDLVKEIESLVKLKAAATEGEMVVRNVMVDNFCRELFSDCDSKAPSLPVASEKGLERLNQFLRRQLKRG